jgi:hypothetical protein
MELAVILANLGATSIPYFLALNTTRPSRAAQVRQDRRKKTRAEGVRVVWLITKTSWSSDQQFYGLVPRLCFDNAPIEASGLAIDIR